MLRVSQLAREQRIAHYASLVDAGLPIDYIPFDAPSPELPAGLPDCRINRIVSKYPQAGIDPMTAREIAGLASDIVRAFAAGQVSQWKAGE